MSSKLPINLEDLLRQRTVEGERIEYKAGWNPDAIIRTLCAFANDFENLGGGYIVIGQDCDDTGRPIFPPKGLNDDQLDRIQKELLQYCNQIQPPYFPMLSLERFENRNLIILWAPGGETRPYKAPKAVTAKKKDHCYYIRRYASTVEAKGEDERELITLTATVPFDDRYNQQATVNDISTRLMIDFLDDVNSGLVEEAADLSTEALGRQMNVVSGPTERPLPKNVGLLFFNDEPHRFFPATQIDVVYFPEGPGGDKFEEKIFQGPLSQITRDALSFIARNYIKETVIKHPDRPEAERFNNFPLSAIEEALVNAVYHRSYEIREPVEVRITPEDLVILSFPGPDRSIKMDDLQSGRAVSRRYRNRRIGEFLKELDLTEGRSTGINKILKGMTANGSPSPEFETDEDRTYFLIRLPVHERSAVTQLGAKVTGEVTSQVTPPEAHDEAHDEAHESMSDVERKLLLFCSEQPKTTNELLQDLGYETRTGNFKRALARMLNTGCLKMTIPNKPRSRKQRYRLTDTGRRWLSQHGGSR